jgi:prepilin-type N-terminal cleavage/methylation domain-containing protein
VIRARLAGESGYSLIEMLTVMGIMAVVMGGLTTLFVQASNAELDMNRRFSAQQEARLALDKIRREIHCSSIAETTPTTGQAAAVKLTLPSQCPTGAGDVTWCTVNVSTGRYALYRKPGASCDATGVKWADHLTEAALFNYQPQSTTSLARLRVHLPVDTKPGDATPAYTLCDQIVLRNSTRTGTSAVVLPPC